MTLAMGAELEITSREGTRRVSADDFFIDLFQTAIEPGELLVAIHVPVIRPGHRWAFHEFARRRGDYALVGCGILAEFRGRSGSSTSASCSFPLETRRCVPDRPSRV